MSENEPERRPYYASIHQMWPEQGKVRPAAERPPQSPFGARVRALRKQKGYTQAWLGARLDISQQAVAQLERGKHPPNASTIHRLAIALNVATTDLTGETVVRDDPMAWLTFHVALDGLQKAIEDLRAAADALRLPLTGESHNCEERHDC